MGRLPMVAGHRSVIQPSSSGLCWNCRMRCCWPQGYPAKMSRFWILLTLSAVIATAGILANSTAAVIGAMIIAPLATPLMGIAPAVVIGAGSRLWRSAVLALGRLVLPLLSTRSTAAGCWSVVCLLAPGVQVKLREMSLSGPARAAAVGQSPSQG